MKDLYVKKVSDLTPEEALKLIQDMQHWGAYRFSMWKTEQTKARNGNV